MKRLLSQIIFICLTLKVLDSNEIFMSARYLENFNNIWLGLLKRYSTAAYTFYVMQNLLRILWHSFKSFRRNTRVIDRNKIEGNFMFFIIYILNFYGDGWCWDLTFKNLYTLFFFLKLISKCTCSSNIM